MDNQPIELGSAGNWLMRYREIQSQIKDLEEQLAQARAHVEEALGESSVGVIDGKPVVKWVWVESTRFDQKKAKELLDPGQLQACMTTQRIRRFDIVREVEQ